MSSHGGKDQGGASSDDSDGYFAECVLWRYALDCRKLSREISLEIDEKSDNVNAGSLALGAALTVGLRFRVTDNGCKPALTRCLRVSRFQEGHCVLWVKSVSEQRSPFPLGGEQMSPYSIRGLSDIRLLATKGARVSGFGADQTESDPWAQPSFRVRGTTYVRKRPANIFTAISESFARTKGDGEARDCSEQFLSSF